MRYMFLFNTNYMSWEDVSNLDMPVSKIKTMSLAILFSSLKQVNKRTFSHFGDVWCMKHQRYEKMYFRGGKSYPCNKLTCPDLPEIGIMTELLCYQKKQGDSCRPSIYCWTVEKVGRSCVGLTAYAAKCFSYKESGQNQNRVSIARKAYRFVFSVETGRVTSWVESSNVPFVEFADFREDKYLMIRKTEMPVWDTDGRFCDRFNIVLPRFVADAAYEVAKEQALAIFGFMPVIDATRTDKDCFKDFYTCPLDMNLPLIADFLGNKFIGNLPRWKQDIFSLVCAYLRIPAVKSIKRDFIQDHTYLIIYKILFLSGFSDINIIRSLAKDIYNGSKCLSCSIRSAQELFNVSRGSIYYDSESGNVLNDGHSSFIEDFQWYCRLIIKEKSEKILAKRLLASMRFEYGRAYYDFSDTIRMAHNLWDTLPDDIRSDVVNNRPDRALHDELAAVATDIMQKNENKDMQYKKDRFTKSVNGYAFRLVHHTKHLRKIGKELHNCVASYRESVVKGHTKIVSVEKEGKLLACLEIHKDKLLRQAKADFNAVPKGDLLKVIAYWSRLCKLKLDTLFDIEEEDCYGWQEWGRDYVISKAEPWK